jgi:3-deoxy-7-phosphoheptulonate synthase
MVVVMSPSANDTQVDAVLARVRDAGGEAIVSRGMQHTIIGLIGDIDDFRALNLRGMPGVANVIPTPGPHPLVSAAHQPRRSSVVVGQESGARPVVIGPDTFTLIAGPCAVESLDQTLEAAEMAQAAGATMLRGGAFRPRTSPHAFPGLGKNGLHILADVRDATGLPIVTEIIDASDVGLVSSYADMLQVGARNMQNYPLLQAAGETGMPILLKRGIDATIEQWLMAAEYVAQQGNLSIVLCERGIRTFGMPTQTTLDIAAIPAVQGLSHLPVIADPTHCAGQRNLVLPLSRAAIAVGADGILVDVHPDPESALCDGPQALAGAQVRELASALRRLTPITHRRLSDLVPIG